MITVRTLLNAWVTPKIYANIRIWDMSKYKLLYESFTSDDDRQDIYMESIKPRIPKNLLNAQVYQFDTYEYETEHFIEISIME